MPKPLPLALPGYQIRQVASTAMTTDVSVRRALRNLPMKPVVRARIENAIRQLGLQHALPEGRRGGAK